MRHLIALMCAALAVSCSPSASTDADLRKAQLVLRGYSDAISRWDYAEMRRLCSPGFRLFEDGEIWTVDDHVAFLRRYEGKASIAYEFTEATGAVDGNVAWFTHRNSAKAQIEGKAISFEWIESAVLRKTNGEWRLVLLHSTTAKKGKQQEAGK